METDIKTSENENVENKGKNTVAFIFGVFMVFVYWGMGCLLLFTELFAESLENVNVRYILGALLLLYGTFRGYRIIKR